MNGSTHANLKIKTTTYQNINNKNNDQNKTDDHNSTFFNNSNNNKCINNNHLMDHETMRTKYESIMEKIISKKPTSDELTNAHDKLADQLRMMEDYLGSKPLKSDDDGMKNAQKLRLFIAAYIERAIHDNKIFKLELTEEEINKLGSIAETLSQLEYPEDCPSHYTLIHKALEKLYVLLPEKFYGSNTVWTDLGNSLLLNVGKIIENNNINTINTINTNRFLQLHNANTNSQNWGFVAPLIMQNGNIVQQLLHNTDEIDKVMHDDKNNIDFIDNVNKFISNWNYLNNQLQTSLRFSVLPTDIHEANLLVNKENGQIKMIDFYPDGNNIKTMEEFSDEKKYANNKLADLLCSYLIKQKIPHEIQNKLAQHSQSITLEELSNILKSIKFNSSQEKNMGGTITNHSIINELENKSIKFITMRSDQMTQSSENENNCPFDKGINNSTTPNKTEIIERIKAKKNELLANKNNDCPFDIRINNSTTQDKTKIMALIQAKKNELANKK